MENDVENNKTALYTVSQKANVGPQLARMRLGVP